MKTVVLILTALAVLAGCDNDPIDEAPAPEARRVAALQEYGAFHGATDHFAPDCPEST